MPIEFIDTAAPRRLADYPVKPPSPPGSVDTAPEFLRVPIPPRPVVISRWAVRLCVWGEGVVAAEEHFWGYDCPVVVRTFPALGPAIATECVGLPVNWAILGGVHAGLRGHYRPELDGPVRATHPETFSGVIESCRADEHGLLGTLLIIRPECHRDLVALDRVGQLGHANVCLTLKITAAVARTPWGVPVVDIVSARPKSLDFGQHAVQPGSRVLRRLELDEELTAADAMPPARLLVPADWRAADAGSVVGDYVPGSVTSSILANLAVLTGKIADLQVTSIKRSDIVTFSGPTYNLGPQTYGSGSITHGLNRRPIAIPWSGHATVFISITTSFAPTTQLFYVLFNSSPTLTANTNPTIDVF